MNMRSALCLLVALALSMAATAVSAAQYAITMVTRTQGPSASSPGSSLCYAQGVKQREEWKTPAGQTAMICIRRPDKGVIWYLMPDRKQCQERPIPKLAKATPVAEELRPKMRSFKRVGAGTIKGYRCDKYEGTQTQGQSTIVSTIWVSTRLNAVLKWEWRYPQGSQTKEAKSIREGRQPDALFEIPPGYRKLALDPGGKATPAW